MGNSIKRFLSLALAIVMIISFIPTNARADEPDVPADETTQAPVENAEQTPENDGDASDGEAMIAAIADTDVAKIGEQGYATLQAAIDACVTGDNTITLLNDSSANTTIKQTDGVNITIDGNGKTYSGVLTIDGNGNGTNTEKLTFKNVTFKTSAKNGILPVKASHNVTFDACTFNGSNGGYFFEISASQYTYNYKFVDCVVDMSGNLWQALSATNNLVVENMHVVNCGNVFKINYGSNTEAPAATFINVVCDNAGVFIYAMNNSAMLFNINNCSIKAEYPFAKQDKAADAHVTVNVSDTTFVSTAGDPVPYTVVDLGAKLYWNVKEPTYVAQIGETGYATLAEAIAVGGEITLLTDVVLDAPLVVTGTVTLDLAGKKVSFDSTVQGEAMITNKGTLTINDSVGTGEIYYNYTGAADPSYGKGNYTISNAGELTVNGGKIHIANLRQHAKYPIDNNSTTGNAVLVINGGHLYNYNTSAIRQFCNSTTYTNSVTINGGLVEGYCAVWVQNPGSKTVNGSLSVTGGEIKTTAAAYVNGTAELKDVSSAIYFTVAGEGGAWSETSSVSITGGTINENVYLAEEAPAAITIGEGATFNGYVELPMVPVAKIGTQGYETLKAAVEAANAMESATIVLNDNVTLGEKLTISGNVTISGAHTITRGKMADDKWYTGTLFVVNAGATLTLDGGLTIDGNNNYAFDKDAHQADVMSRVNVAKDDSAKWFTPEAGKPVASAFMITTTGGTINLNNVTIQNNYSLSSGVISAGANSTITLTGAKITHVASINGNGVVANVDGANINVILNDGTVIDGNHVGGNHGLFKIYSGAKVTMNGGKISNNTGWNSNGVVVGMWGSATIGGVVYGSAFIMNGGEICSNSGVNGPSNGRNAAIYGHTQHVFIMNGGTICHNTGGAYGGLDAPYSNGTTQINGGAIVNNVSASGGAYYDVNGTSAMEITGGTFTQDVSKWMAPGCGLVYDEATRTYGVTIKLFEVNGTAYETFEAALEAVEDNGTIKVLASHTASGTMVVDKNVTIDLNGMTINGSGTINPIFRILADVTVTGNGMIDTANQGDGYCFIVGNSDGVIGNLTIENGTFKGNCTAISVTKGTATLLDGDFRVKPYENSYEYLLNCVDANYKDGSAKIIVKGGVFTNFNPTNNAAEGAGTNFCAEGYIAEELTTGKWTVRQVNYVAEVNGTKYESLQAAINAAEGKTIVLIDNVTVNQTVVVPAGKTITLDLNGKTVSMETADNAMYALILNKGNLTITGDGKLSYKYTGTNSSDAYNTIETAPGSVLTVKGGTIENLSENCLIAYAIDGLTNGNGGDVTVNIEGGKISSKKIAVRIFANSTTNTGNLNISGGEISGRVIIQSANTNANKAVLNITGGTITTNGYKADVLYVGGTGNASGITASVSGGTFNGEILSGLDKGFISGGTFDEAVTEAYCAAGYIPVKNSDGTYGVKTGKFVARVNGVGYETLAEAIAAAQAGNTITLLADVAMSDILVINKAITLDGNGHKLTSTAGRAINIETDGTVVISDLTINAKGERAVNIINKPATVVLNNVTATAKNNAVNIATSAGAVKLTINDSDLTGLAVVNVAGAGSQVAINDTKITNVDATEVESYGAITVYTTATNANVAVSGGEIIVYDDSVKAVVFASGATVTGVDQVKTIVAMVGGYGFFSFAEAVEYAKAGDTIVLIRDVTASDIIVIDKAITLDGNGHKLTSTAGRAINVSGADGVTIKNLTIKASGERAINIIQNATNVTIENVTATAANYTVNLAGSAANAVVAISNSNLTGLNVVNVAAANAVVTVDSTTLICNDQTEVESYAALCLNKDATNATITATGVTFYIEDNSVKASNQAVGGTITIDGSADDVIVHVAYISYGNNWYGFTTLEDAIAKAKDGETIVLIRDVTASKIITIDKAITLDGNGKTLTSTAGRAINVSGANGVTIKNLTINASGERAINVISGATNVTIDNVTATAANYTVNVAASAANAVVAINKSTLNGLCTVNVAGAGAKVTITDSTINCNDNNTTAGESYAALCLNKAAIGGSIIATGTTVNVTEGSDSTKGRNGAENGTVTINGSTEGVAITVAVITYEGSDYYYGFESVAAAIDFAKEGDTITLIRDITASEIITINKAITLDGNGNTLTSTAGRAINIETDGTVVISDLTINAKGERAVNIINKPATVELNNVTATAKNNAVMIATSAGAVKLTINDSDLTGLAVVNVAGAGSQVAINDTKITNVDATEVESYGAITVYTTATNANVAVSGGEIIVYDDSVKAVVFASGATVTGVDPVKTIVAMVGGYGFFSFAEAVEYAKAGDTIVLLTTVKITEDTTLDLNGKTVSGSGAAMFQVSGTLTLVDSSAEKTGAIVHTGDSDSTSAIALAGGNLIVESGSIISNHKAIQAGGTGKTNTVTINGGVITGSDVALNLNKGTNTVSVTGGKLVGGNAVHVSSKATVAEFTISGGEFTGNLRDIPEGKLTITGGTFTVDPSAYVAEGYIAEELTTDKWTVRKANYVAEVNGTKYESLTEAIAAAKEAGAAVTVLKTIVLTEDGTLDLKGVRLNASSNLQNAPVIRVLAKIEVINAGIIDGRGPVAGEGGINCYAFIVGNSEVAGELTITGGTYRGVTTAISITKGICNISGGTFQTGHDNEGTDYGATYLLNCVDSAYKNGTAKFNITGGMFVGFNPAANVAEGKDTNFLSGNYKASDYYGDNKWYVAEANVELTIGDRTVYCDDIYEALNVIQPRETATIKLLSDFTITADQRMFSNYSLIINAEYVTLDLNGKTVTFDYEGSTAICYAAIAIYNQGTLTIIDSSEDKTGTLYSKTKIQGNDGPRILWVTSAGSATIEGGNFISEQGDTMFYCSNSNMETPTTLYIKDGYFEHTIPTSGSTYRYFNIQDGGGQEIIEVSGGVWAHNPTDNEMRFPEGFEAGDNSDGTWGVVESVRVAQIGETKYETLSAAIKAATAGDTITLIDNVTEDVTVDKSITIDGAKFTYTGAMTLKADTTIKNVNFDGKGFNGYAITTRGAQYLTIEDCTAKNYGYGFVQLASATALTTVKNVTVSNMNYGVKVDYSGAVILENVDMTAGVAAVLNSNYGEKTITIKNSKLNILGTWKRNDTTKTTYVFEGANSIAQFLTEADLDIFKLAADATLTAPEGLTVTTDVKDMKVAYEGGKYQLVKAAIAKIGKVEYASLQEAVDAAKAGQTITLICDAEGPGVVINKSVNINFGGFTYTLTEGVGSTGTESNGIQLLKGNTVKLTNGTLKVAESAASKFYILIQNYGYLTVNGMTLDGTNLDKWSGSDGDSYVVSNNSGTFNANSQTKLIVNNDGDKAFAIDACDKSSWGYELPVVTVSAKNNIYVDKDTKATDPYQYIEAAAYRGNYFYATLQQAVTEGGTITLFRDVAGSGVVVSTDININFGGHTYTFTEGVGSTGTESNGFQLLKGTEVVLRNGTLKVADSAANKFYILIQNYSDSLSLANMILDGTNLDKWSKTDGDSYVLSNNSGNVSIDGQTTIIANDDGALAFAFDACDKSAWGYELPVVTVHKNATINGNIEAAAKIGNVYYATLHQAIDAATNNQTITLMSNIEMNTSDAITCDGLTTMFAFNGKSLTLDMNGKTISVNYDSSTLLYSVIYVGDGASLTVKGDGKINLTTGDTKAGNYDCVAYMFLKRGTTGNLTIENGTFTANKLEDSMVYTNGDKVVNVKDGTWTLANVGTETNGAPWIFNTKGQNASSILVSGGTYNFNVGMQYYAHEVDIVDANGDLGIIVDNGNGTWTVTGETAEAAIMADVWGGYDKAIGYVTLAKALDAAKPGQTVLLMQDIVLEKSVAITGNRNVVIDLHGHTLSSAKAHVVTCYYSKTTITIKDSVGGGEVRTDGNGKHAFVVQSNLVIDGAEICSTKGGNAIVAQTVNANVTIQNDAVINGKVVAKAGKLTITGGTFNNKLEITAGVEVAISAGYFKHPVDAAWCAEGYIPTGKLENGYYSVMEDPAYGMVAMVTNGETVSYFETLAAAIAAAEDGATVTVLADIDLANVTTVKLDDAYNTYFKVEGKSITINLNGKTISGTYTATDMLVGVFSTENNGHLVLTGNGTVNVTAAGTVYSLIANYEPGCSIVIENGTYALDVAKDSLIYSGVTANEGDLSKSGGIIVKGGNFTLGNVGTGANGSPWIFNVLGRNSGHIWITGGTFNADVFKQYWSVEVQHPDNVTITANGNGTYTVG